MTKRKPAEREVPIDSLAYSMQEAGKRMGGICEPTVKDLIETGKLKAIRIGQKRIVVPRCSIIQYLNEQIKEAQPQ